MGFFDLLPMPDPEPEPAAPPPPVWMKPEAALPGVVPETIVLARTASTAIAVNGLWAYAAGFELTLAVVLRHEERRPLRLDRGLLHGWARHAGDPLPDEFLRFGVQFPDGAVATNVAGPPYRLDSDDPAGPILLPGGGGGGGRRYDLNYWIWPLPTAGRITFVCQWPAFGIPESCTDIDAGLILDAARRAIELWPSHSERDEQPTGRS
jgi:hypothetical protein